MYCELLEWVPYDGQKKDQEDFYEITIDYTNYIPTFKDKKKGKRREL